MNHQTLITKTQKDPKLKNKIGNIMKFQNLKLEKERERESTFDTVGQWE